MSEYPDECPAFRINGKDYEVRPGVAFSEECFGGLIAVNSATGEVTLWQVDYFPEAFEPLTPAALELLAWSRQ
jgi:hypothetical protein